MSESARRDESPARVVWVGDSGVAAQVEADAGVTTTAVEDPAELRTAIDDAVACVVVGDPPASLRSALSSLPVPVVAYADADPADVSGVADDYVRRTGDGVGRLVDRLEWHAANESAAADDRRKVEQLHDIATELLSCREGDAVHELVVDAAERVLAFDICTVDAVEDGQLVPKAVSEGLADDGYEAAPVEAGGLAGKAHRTGETLVVDDVRECGAASPATDEYRSVLTVPIGEAAVFQAGSTAVGAFDATDRDLAELLATHAEGTLHRIRSERAVRQRHETIERLHDTVARMVACESEGELCDLLVEAAEQQLDFSVCVVVSDDLDSGDLVVRSASDVDLAPEEGMVVPDDRRQARATYRTGESVLIDDVEDHGVADPHEEGYRSAVSVPLGDHGAVQAISTERGAFDEHDLEMAELLASQAGAVLTRLRAEGRLRTERDRIRALFDHVPDPAVSFAFEGADLLVRDVNPAFEETFGYDADAVVGENVDDYIVPDGESETAAALNERLRAGDAFHREVRRVPADGDPRDFILHVVPTAEAGGVTGYAIYTDITERKRRERRLDALNETTRELLGATDGDAVCEIAVEAAREILDLPVTGVFRREDDQLVLAAASASAWELFDGPPPTFGPGDAAWTAFEAGDSRLVADADTVRLVGDAPVESVMVSPLGDHGAVVSAGPDAEAFDEVTRDLAGVLAANVEAALDRAERERRLRDRERELQRQNDRLEEFASVVSHDLRTPLSVARGHLELARQDRDDEALEKVADAHRRMDDLIENLLQLARNGQVVGDPERVDVAEVARDAWVDGDATLDIDDPGTVEADRDRLVQLLENLFRNAVEHGSTSPASQTRQDAAGASSGEPSVADAPEDAVERGSTSSRPEADDATEHAAPDVSVTVGSLGDDTPDEGFYVADDGPGIPEDEREEVFERGYSTDDGTGFGLAIVREIAEAHGWAVSVAEGELGGARFEIRTG